MFVTVPYRSEKAVRSSFSLASVEKIETTVMWVQRVPLLLTMNGPECSEPADCVSVQFMDCTEALDKVD